MPIKNRIELLNIDFKEYGFYLDKSKIEDELCLEVSADYSNANNDMDVVNVSGTKEELLDIFSKITESIRNA